VPREDGSDSPDFDHLALRIDLDEPWLADVGFGDSFLETLNLFAWRRAATGWLELSSCGLRKIAVRGESGPRWNMEAAVRFHINTAKS